jgi:hypothetical protein
LQEFLSNNAEIHTWNSVANKAGSSISNKSLNKDYRMNKTQLNISARRTGGRTENVNRQSITDQTDQSIQSDSLDQSVQMNITDQSDQSPEVERARISRAGIRRENNLTSPHVSSSEDFIRSKSVIKKPAYLKDFVDFINMGYCCDTCGVI